MYVIIIIIIVNFWAMPLGASAVQYLNSNSNIYARHPRASAYISGKARVPVWSLICYTSGTLKIYPNLKSTAQLAYIVTDADCDCGRYIYILTFPNISMMYQYQEFINFSIMNSCRYYSTYFHYGII